MLDCFLESCCTSVEEVLEAQRRGARRIELCTNLEVGGVTPSRELVAEVKKAASIPVNVLVRPRGGDFLYNEEEVRQMISGVVMCREMGVDGVVMGALDSAGNAARSGDVSSGFDGNVDIAVMKRLAEAAGPLNKTFHRAFDRCREPMAALSDVIALGFDHLLTSGHAADAFQGRFLLADLVAAAGDSLTVMPGCGVRAANIQEIRTVTGAREFHASAAFWL